MQYRIGLYIDEGAVLGGVPRDHNVLEFLLGGYQQQAPLQLPAGERPLQLADTPAVG